MKPDQPNIPSSPFNPPPGQPEPADAQPAGKRQELTAKARQAKDTLKEKSAAMAHNVKHKSEDYAHERKDKIAEKIDRYGEQFEDASGSFEGEDPNIAWLTHRAAERLSDLAEHVRDRDFRSLWADAEEVARRHPLAFVGGMFAAGVAAGSFVRSARSDHDSFESENADYAGGFEGVYASPAEEPAWGGSTPGGTTVRDF